MSSQMASSPTTALHPQNRNQKDHVRIVKHQELNTFSERSRVRLYTGTSSKRGAENKDPNEPTKPSTGGHKLTGVSKLPVLAKSLQPTVKNISPNLAHKRWEERPLLGKSHKRKTCTKPVPFNFSQPRIRNQKGTDSSSEPTCRSGNPVNQLTTKTLSVSRHRSKTVASNQNITSGKNHTEPSNRGVVQSVSLSKEIQTTTVGSMGKGRCLESAIQKDLSTKLANITLAHSKLSRDGRFSSKAGGSEDRGDCRPSTKGCVKSPLSTEVENTMPFSPDPSALRSILLNDGNKVRDTAGANLQVSPCPSGRGTSIYSALRVPVRKPQTHAAASISKPAGRVVPFSPDPSALRSILLDEGLNQGTGMTLGVCPSGRPTSICSARRVPVKKKASAAGAILFSPDPSALQSILQNEGVTAGSAGMQTPRVSVCPLRRATSIYTAQRVPVNKSREDNVVCTGISRTPISKWMPLRVSASQSVRKPNSTHNTRLNISPGFSDTDGPRTSFTKQEGEVVQRLFQEEPEHEGNEQMEDGGDEVTPGHSQNHHQTAGHELKHQDERGTNIELNCCLLQKEKLPAAQPFIQASHRQSVIVFSSGQKPLAQNGAQTVSIQTPWHAAQLHPWTDQTSRSQSESNPETGRAVSPGKHSKTKASSLSLAMCALRRRLPPLQEMFLDEECAMYTSRQQLWPTLPRCCNPVASTLLFQDSTCFVPIIMPCPSRSPVPPLASPIEM